MCCCMTCATSMGCHQPSQAVSEPRLPPAQPRHAPDTHPAALQAGAGLRWVCEGAFDVLALLAAGVSRVVAIFGVQGWRWDWARAVRELVFALDADAAGQQQWRQLARQAALRGKRVAVLPPAGLWWAQRCQRGVGRRGPSRWTRGPHQQRRQERGSLFLRTSTRSGRSAWRSCSRTVISCPPTPHGGQGRDSKSSGRCGDAWDHTPYRSWATSACQGTLVSALRGLMERAKVTQWPLSDPKGMPSTSLRRGCDTGVTVLGVLLQWRVGHAYFIPRARPVTP